MDEAIQDYLHCFRAQQVLDDAAAQMDAMRAAARELHSRAIGRTEHLPHGTYRFWIEGKFTAAGPRRLTLAEAQEDGAKMVEATSSAETEEERRSIAQAVLQSLCKESSVEGGEEVKAARRHFTEQAKLLKLSQSAQEHAGFLALSFETERIRSSTRQCSAMDKLHGLSGPDLTRPLP